MLPLIPARFCQFLLFYDAQAAVLGGVFLANTAPRTAQGAKQK
jgi:hypothetical protein